MGHRQRQLLLLGCAILAIVGAFMGYRLIRPQLGPARVEHDPLNGPPEALAGDPPSRLTGAAGAGATAHTPAPAPGAPPPPTPPSSTGTAPPSVGRFRATGLVRSGDDGPGIPHATVEIFQGFDAQGSLVGRGETDEAGRFAIDLPALDAASAEARSRVSLAARARARDYRIGHVMPFAQEDLSGAAHDVEGTLFLFPGHDVSGRVVDENGRPVEGVRTTLYDASPAGMLTTVTDAEGRYRFPIVRSGPAFLLAQRFGVGTASRPETVLSADADAEWPDLVLRKGEEVAGTAVNAAGRPIAGVPVYAESLSVPSGGAKEAIGAPSGTDYGSAMTDAEGRFRVTGLFPGQVLLTAVAQGPGLPQGETVDTGRTDVRLVVAGHVLRVVVVDSAGAPLRGAKWSVAEMDASPPPRYEGVIGLGIERSDVGFALVMEGASVRVAASQPGCADAVVETKCEGAGPSEVTLRLVRAGAPGRVRLALGGEAAARVVALSVRATSVASGAAVGIPGHIARRDDAIELPPGRHRLQVLPLDTANEFDGSLLLPVAVDADVPSGGDVTVPVPVTLGGRVKVTLAWPEGAKSAQSGVIVTSLDGAPAPGSVTWIQTFDRGAAMGSSIVLQPGPPFWSAAGLPPGRWLLDIRVDGYAPVSVAATVTAGETTSVTAVLERKAK